MVEVEIEIVVDVHVHVAVVVEISTGKLGGDCSDLTADSSHLVDVFVAFIRAARTLASRTCDKKGRKREPCSGLFSSGGGVSDILYGIPLDSDRFKNSVKVGKRLGTIRGLLESGLSGTSQGDSTASVSD